MSGEEYNFLDIEKKWQEIWEKEQYGVSLDFSDKEKYYHLIEFPYPSGSGLHVGHCMMYTAADAVARMMRAKGKNVMLPMGWDAFGLPTENYAIKTGILPQEATKENIAVFKKQIKSLGYSFDWSREINTTDPNYYKWTQWIFLQFYKHAVVDPSTGSGQAGKLVQVADDDTTTPRLAFQAEIPINWCSSCKIGLANEEVIAGKCERCGAETERRTQKQWMLRITAYADRLIKDLETVDYLERIKTQQVNWIGRSEGSDIEFRIKNLELRIKVFTTRADTLFGCTYVVLAPENPLVQNLKFKIQNLKEVDQYIEKAAKKSDLERTEMQKEKTGVELKGIKAINPINNEEVPVFIADYVLANYGTGAVMAVPAHDQRDWDFAKKYDILIKEVVIPKVIDKNDPPIEGKETIFRKAIQAVIVNPKNNKVLVLKWKKFPWTTFITGGIEENEDVVDSAKREILEETGYKNVKFVKKLGGIVESHFFANHKNENRKAHFQGILFELENDERDEPPLEEKAIHEAEWVSWDELDNDKNTKCAEYDIWIDRINNPDHSFDDYGVLINSDEFDGLQSREAINNITKKLKEIAAGDFTVNYKLRDWIFSRQHYWGEPIPIVHCDKCGVVPVSEEDLPIELPIVEKYQPTNTGESPLSAINDWVNVKCPKCGSDGKRETDTMPNWAGSSWYFLAYAVRQAENGLQTTDNQSLFDEYRKEIGYWMPIDLYDGGMEHTTLHLLYSRFWHKFLYDLGKVETAEPYSKRVAHGIILGPDGQKMSKSKGNVINPDEIASEFGADALRAYIMFIGPYDQESAWSTAGLQGVSRFLKRVWKNHELISQENDDKALLIKLNQTIQGVSDDILSYKFNTVISKLMEFNNTMEKTGHITRESFEKYLILLHTSAPHIASELWQILGNDSYIFNEPWVSADKNYLISDTITVVYQINGKIKDKENVNADISDKELEDKAKNSTKVIEFLEKKNIIKIIVVPKKLVNIVVN